MTMESRENKPAEHLPEAEGDLSAQDLYTIEMYFRNHGVSDFQYDAELNGFRFPEDGRFAFCEEFADWKRLEERGYLEF